VKGEGRSLDLDRLCAQMKARIDAEGQPYADRAPASWHVFL